MTRNEARHIARANMKARQFADIENLFHNGPPVDDAKFGYRHGWYLVQNHSFSTDELTGIPYDPDQGGWAYL